MRLFPERHIVLSALLLLTGSGFALILMGEPVLLAVLAFVERAFTALALIGAWTVLTAALLLLLLIPEARSLIAPVVRHDGFLSVTPRPVGPGSNSNATADEQVPKQLI